MATALHDLTAVELVKAFAKKRLSPVEAMEAVLARGRRLNFTLNAFYRTDAKGALAAAKASERRWARGQPLGPMDGVPVSIKDGLAVKGWRSPRGTRANDGIAPAKADAPLVARLKESGAIIFAKTTMPDLGMLPSGVSSLHGVTRNPWNLARNTGGSSSGAGAAVAAGMGPASIGTDIGGSVRIPAAFCGIVGLKPSGGRVPYSVPSPMLAAGPMTRTVADTALMMNVITRPDLRDFMALPYQARDYLAGLRGASAKGLRLGLLLDMGYGLALDAEVRQAVEKAASLLQSLGAKVEPMRPILALDQARHIERYFLGRAWTEFASYTAAQRRQVLPYIARWVEAGARFSASDMFRSMAALANLRERVIAACAAYDFVLSPVMPVASFAADAALPNLRRGLESVCFTAPINQTEAPAASINCGFSRSGVPIGLHIVGQRHDDMGVLRLAKAYEDARPDQRPWPDPI
ncbi:MAG: amidase [Alphaproteobacteria bacterium]|nr:amidase [Alphaproteobacteria bacterium]